MTIQAIWDRIEAWLKHYAPEEFSCLQPGATDQDIQEAETALGMTFPEEVRALYRLHNGGALIADPRYSFWELLCLEDIVDGWNSNRRFDHGLLAPLQPEDQVQRRNWDLHWIPLLQKNDGTMLCLDLAPGPAGQRGQIILVFWENGERPVIVASFCELLSTFADDLEAGIYTWDEEVGTLDLAQPLL